jgi:hypothetical protein
MLDFSSHSSGYEKYQRIAFNVGYADLCNLFYARQIVAITMRRPRDRRIYQRLSRQRLGKHESTRNNRATVGNRVLSTWSVPRSYLENNWGDRVSSVRE